MAEPTDENQGAAYASGSSYTLTDGDTTLDASMALFEEGTALLRRCGAMLDAAEQRVVQLRKGPDGAPQELPFDVPADS